MKVTYQFPRTAKRLDDVYLDDSIPPDVGEIVILDRTLGPITFVVQKRTFRLKEDVNFTGVYTPEVVVELREKG